MRRALALAVALALLPAIGTAGAQRAPAGVGARVRVLDPAGRRLPAEGRVERLTPDSVFVRADRGRLAFGRAGLPPMEISLGRPDLARNVAGAGTLTAIAGGLLGGALLGSSSGCPDCVQRSYDRRSGALYGGAFGAAIGVLIGVSVSHERWVPVRLLGTADE